MKKIVAIFLLLAIMTIFVSCGDKEETENQPTLNTSVQDIEPTTAGPTEPAGIVLTTDPAKMAQWGYVTEFIPTEYTQPTYPTVSVPALTDNTERPTPQISQVTINPDNTTTTNNNGASGNNGGTTNNTGPTVSEITSPTDETPTSEVQKTPKPISVGSSSISNDRKGEFLDKAILDVSATGWDGSIVANSTNATVSYAGNEYKAPCSVSASLNSQGCYEIVITLSGLEIPAGTDGITVSIPEGFIKNSADTQYSMSFSRRM